MATGIQGNGPKGGRHGPRQIMRITPPETAVKHGPLLATSQRVAVHRGLSRFSRPSGVCGAPTQTGPKNEPVPGGRKTSQSPGCERLPQRSRGRSPLDLRQLAVITPFGQLAAEEPCGSSVGPNRGREPSNCFLVCTSGQYARCFGQDCRYGTLGSLPSRRDVLDISRTIRTE
jgi:hypothetical protein